MNHYLLPISKIQEKLHTSAKGLDTADAEQRIKQHGKNVLTEKKENLAFVLVLRQFKDVMIFILLLATLISFFFSAFKRNISSALITLAINPIKLGKLIVIYENKFYIDAKVFNICLFYVLLKINTNEKIIISNNIVLQKVTSVNI